MKKEVEERSPENKPSKGAGSKDTLRAKVYNIRRMAKQLLRDAEEVLAELEK